MSELPPQVLIFTAIEPPLYKKYIGHKTDLYFYFSVPVEQIEAAAPHIYAKLITEGRENAVILVGHASEAGVMPGETHDAIARVKPDMVYTCFSRDARRLNGQYPICGHYEGVVLATNPELGSRIVMIQPG